VFRPRLAQALEGPAWVVTGNYNNSERDITWGRADALVWLDYWLGIILWRLFRRALAHTLSREVLWGTNRETWSDADIALYNAKSLPRSREE
jgi:hypothetical protein